MTQDELKQAVGQAAADYVAAHAPAGCVLGVGTGSTANCFIDAIAPLKNRFRGAVASSEATRRRLEDHGVPVLDLNTVEDIPIYVDGADEINGSLHMIKGGGGALTREKIVAAVARSFVCIADASKQVATLGRFPLPVEVIPMARALVARELAKLGGHPHLREGFITDNGNLILDDGQAGTGNGHQSDPRRGHQRALRPAPGQRAAIGHRRRCAPNRLADNIMKLTSGGNDADV